MLKIGNRIRLNARELRFLEVCADCRLNPQTEEDLAECIRFVKSKFASDDPIDRLFTRLLDDLACGKF